MITDISERMKNKRISAFDALLEIIEEQDLEPAEVVKTLPAGIVGQLKEDAIQSGRLRPSFAALLTTSVSIDAFFQ